MKPTQEQILQWAREAGYMPDRIKFDVYQYMPIVTLAYEAGRKDENEACAKVCEELGYYAKHGGWGCADAIRERGENNDHR